jgi:hypothetical protein
MGTTRIKARPCANRTMPELSGCVMLQLCNLIARHGLGFRKVGEPLGRLLKDLNLFRCTPYTSCAGKNDCAALAVMDNPASVSDRLGALEQRVAEKGSMRSDLIGPAQFLHSTGWFCCLLQ